MSRWGSLLLFHAALSGAPFQCASEAEPSRAFEETPGEALYELANDFKRQGQEAAWRRTLTRIIERYPASRFAAMAERDLALVAPKHSEDDDSAGRPSRAAASPQ